MSPDVLLALALMLAPPDAPAPDPAMFSRVGAAISRAAVRAEILDPRETLCILTQHGRFAADLIFVRQRVREYAGAPRLHDALRFPDRATAGDLIAVNRDYRRQMEARQALELVRWREFREAAQEADALFRVWDAARDAACDYYYVTVRRDALRKLRSLLGDDAYFSADLPPPVPLWRFRPID